MAQNISLLGASYPDVPAVILPKTGGGTASFTDVTDTTAVASDVAQGKYFYTAAGARTEGTASGGGGGASNVVAGTITMGNTAEWQDVTVQYTGNGYPIAMMIWPDDGWADVQDTFYNKVDRYSNVFFQFVKNYPTSSPTYSGSGTENQFTFRGSYKSSNSDPTATSSSGTSTVNFLNPASGTPGSFAYNSLKMDSKTALHVYVHTNGSSTRGFSMGVKYRYCIVYSS